MNRARKEKIKYVRQEISQLVAESERICRELVGDDLYEKCNKFDEEYAELDKARIKKFIADVKAYNYDHPIRQFYVFRDSEGHYISYCVEGPEYERTIGSLWHGSHLYLPGLETGILEPKYTYVTAYDKWDATNQARQLPEWEWHSKFKVWPWTPKKGD